MADSFEVEKVKSLIGLKVYFELRKCAIALAHNLLFTDNSVSEFN